MTCLHFSYTTTTKECRGYNSLPHNSVSQANTNMWRRNNVCRLAEYTYDPAFRVCIRLYRIDRTWNESLESCTNDTAYLLILDTREKVQATQTGVHKDRFAERVSWWVGGYDYDDGPANDFKWSNGDSIAAPSDLWYNPVEPSGAAEKCVNLFLFPDALGINDWMCSKTSFYICQEDI